MEWDVEGQDVAIKIWEPLMLFGYSQLREKLGSSAVSWEESWLSVAPFEAPLARALVISVWKTLLSVETGSSTLLKGVTS